MTREEAIKKIKTWDFLDKDEKEAIETLIPELVESEDERISREIIEFILTHRIDEPNDIEDTNSWLAWLEKQGEQKPADKVESKFKMEKGKWYVCDTSRYTDFIVGKAYYCPKNGMLKPNENAIARYVARDCFHLWSIQDAKYGDILASGDWVFIFRKFHINGLPKCHCHYDLTLEEFKVDTDSYMAGGGYIYPATKEQRKLLFSKMKEVGYKWNEEKKELEEIKKTSKWSEEDEKRLQSCISTLQGKGLMGGVDTINTKWPKSLKQKLL